MHLNQRPLGYEPNGQKLSPIDFNAFSSCHGAKNHSNSPSFGPLLDPIFGRRLTRISETTPPGSTKQNWHHRVRSNCNSEFRRMAFGSADGSRWSEQIRCLLSSDPGK